jgi:hypothetical protein
MNWIRNLAHRVLQITHGRTTAFFIAFFLAGHAMALAGKLTETYVHYMFVLGTLVVGHSIKDDFAAAKLGLSQQGGAADDTDAKS